MTRREFPRSVKVAVVKRATRESVVYCEACCAQAKRWQIDHVRPDGLGGDPTLGNAMLICEACFSAKNPADTRAIAKAKRREARHIGVKTPPAVQIKSRGFTKAVRDPRAGKARIQRVQLPPRQMFKETTK